MGFLNLNNVQPLASYFDSPVPFASLYVYLAGTDRLAALFDDENLTISRENPLKADDQGVFPIAYVLEGLYRIVVRDDFDEVISDTDDVHVRTSLSFVVSHEFTEVDDMFNDQVLSYQATDGRQPVGAGDILRTAQTETTYRVAPETATDAHIESNGGVRFYVNSNRYDLKAESFGIKFTGDSQDAALNASQMKRALDWLGSEGQGGRVELASEGHMLIDLPLIMRDDVIIDGKGTIVENSRTTDFSPGFRATSCFVAGLMHPLDANDFTFNAVAAVTSGQQFFEPPNINDWQVGDLAMIVDAQAQFGNASGDLPNYGQFLQVVAINGGRCYTEFPIKLEYGLGGGTLGTDAEGAWVANITYRVTQTLNSGLIDGRHMVRRPTLLNTRVSCASGPWMSRTATYKGYFENIEVVDSAYAFLVNSLAHTIVRDFRGSFHTRAIEIKYLSHDSTLSGFDLHYSTQVSDTSAAPETPMSFGEGSDSVVVSNGTMNFGQASGMSSLVSSAQSNNCAFRDIVFSGNAGFSSAILHNANETVYDGLVFDCGSPSGTWVSLSGKAPIVQNCRFNGDTMSSAAFLQSALEGGRLVNNVWTTDGEVVVQPGMTDFVDVIGNRGISFISPSSFNHLVHAYGNGGSEWDGLRQLNVSETTGGGITIDETVETLVDEVVVVPAGQLRAGDRYRTSILADCSGSNGTRTVKLNFPVDEDSDGVALDVDDDSNIAANFTLPSSCTEFRLEVEFTIQSSTQFTTYAKVSDLTNGTDEGKITRHTGVDYANHEMRVELSANVANGSDKIIFRDFQREMGRYGMS